MIVNNLRMSFAERVQRCLEDEEWWESFSDDAYANPKDFWGVSFEDYIEGVVWEGLDLDEEEQKLWEKNPYYWKEEPLEGCALF